MKRILLTLILTACVEPAGKTSEPPPQPIVFKDNVEAEAWVRFMAAVQGGCSGGYGYWCQTDKLADEALHEFRRRRP